MSSIVGLVRPEGPELFTLELKKMPYLTVYYLASTIFNQSALHSVKIYIIMKSWMSLIMGLIGLE